MSTNDSVHPWPLAKRILFRFLFVFFILKIFFTIDFVALTSGIPMPLVQWSQEVFTPPCLWLNNNVFHFYYNPYKWYTLTHALLWVRFIVYVAIAVVACGVWMVFQGDKRQHEQLDFWWRQFLSLLLSCVIFGYGIMKVFPVQMAAPDLSALDSRLGNLHPFDLFWATMGYGKPYQVFTGAGEVLAAILLLFRRTRVAGLLILLFILMNIVVINYAFSIGVLGLASFLLLITVYLLAPYGQNLRRFFANQPASVHENVRHYRLATPWKKWALTAIAVLAVGASYYMTFKRAYTRFTKRRNDNGATTYFAVNTFVCNNDTLDAVHEGDSIRWRYWTEKISDKDTTVTVYTTQSDAFRSYTVSKDSAGQVLELRLQGSENTTPDVLKYAMRDSILRVEGNIGGRSVMASLQQIAPDEYFKLFKVRPRIIEVDPEEY